MAEEAARKEIQLRVQAERKAREIEKKVTLESAHQQSAFKNSESLRIEAELAQAKVTAESIARAEAEARASKADEQRLRAEAAARKEVEMRMLAEQKAREFVERYTNNLPITQAKTRRETSRDKVAIALLAAIATFLFLALVMLIITMISLY